MTTWKNSGEIKANSCRKNDVTSTSLSRCRYLWIAPRNQVMSKRRVISDNPARRVIRISPPSQTARSSPRVIKAGRVLSGLGEHQEPAIAENCNSGQGRVGKPRPLGPVGTYLEPEILGAAEYLRC